MTFDPRYSRCEGYKKTNIICDELESCVYCNLKGIKCEKKSTLKQIMTNKKGERYCRPVNYKAMEQNMYIKHRKEIDKIGRKTCESCRNLRYCDIASVTMNNCCNISIYVFNRMINLMLNLFNSNNFTSFYHYHVLYKSCFITREKTTTITRICEKEEKTS